MLNTPITNAINALACTPTTSYEAPSCSIKEHAFNIDIGTAYIAFDSDDEGPSCSTLANAIVEFIEKYRYAPLCYFEIINNDTNRTVKEHALTYADIKYCIRQWKLADR